MLLKSAAMGLDCRLHTLPGFIGQRYRRVEVLDVLIDMAADLAYLQKLLLKPMAVFAHAQMQPEDHTLKKGQFPIHRLGHQPRGFPAFGHHQHGSSNP
ncbi:MAG: hypothetical protein QNJ01_01930 [Desulfobacterales bacterium]|nr:hypothetical protein [Desulfobacterales bacterium]